MTMYTHKINKLAKNTIEIIVDIPKDTVKKEYDSSFLYLKDNLELQGFRKGKVPREIAEKNIKKELVYEQMVKSLVPNIYQEVIKKENLKPVISPKIELIKAKENEDWQIKITLAEKPIIDLGRYRDVIRKVRLSQKKEDIWVPGKNKGASEPSEKEKSKNQQELLNTILAAILKEIKIEISEIIIEEELNHRLTNLLTDIQKIGLTVETYLKSKNLTQEQLRDRYRKEIEETYKLEFILSEVAEKENITVEQKDLDQLFAKITDPKERESAKANSYFYASILRKQKTLDYLLTM